MRVRRLMAIMVVSLIIFTGCSNGTVSNEVNNTDFSQKESEDKISHKTESNEEDIDSEEDADSDENTQTVGERIYGRVKSIIGNEVEIELGNAPDWDVNKGDEDDDKKKPGVPMIRVEKKETPPGFEDFYAPDPVDPIFGENGEINLIYTGETKTLIIQAGTKIRNILGKTATLEEIKKGTVIMITPKVVDGKDTGIEMLTILK
jgi:hypothetical protein